MLGEQLAERMDRKLQHTLDLVQIKRESVVGVLEENCAGTTYLTNERGMIALDIDILVQARAVIDVKVDWWVVFILAKLVVCRENASNHVVDSRLRD